MTDVPNAPVPLKDRRSGLIGCGIVWLLFGVLFIGFCLLMVLTLSVAPPGAARAAMPVGMIAYTSLFYLALAALFLTLGVGSIMARRWAPPLILVVSTGWLICGAATAAVMGIMLPKMMASMPSDPGAKASMVGCMSATFGISGIAVPLVFILFYRSAHVKATVERVDPVPRWTDHQPISLLIFVSWMFFGAVSVLLSSFMYRALPFGSFMLRGWQVFAVMAFMATLLFWIGIGSLRRLRAAWWSAVLLLIIGAAWGALFVGMKNPTAMYEAMGMPIDPQQAQMVEAMYSSPFFAVWMVIFWSAYLAFLLYLRRYFFPRSERPAI